MPTISMFYGILVSMYVLDTQKHHLPHIHIRYAEFKAVIEIPSGNLLDGELPGKQIASTSLGRPAQRRTDGRLDNGCCWRDALQDRAPSLRSDTK
jgi:hypothetical protein